jgi:hypothetical protein
MDHGLWESGGTESAEPTWKLLPPAQCVSPLRSMRPPLVPLPRNPNCANRPLKISRVCRCRWSHACRPVMSARAMLTLPFLKPPDPDRP